MTATTITATATAPMATATAIMATATAHYGDRDRDGVPNYADRRPNDPYAN